MSGFIKLDHCLIGTGKDLGPAYVRVTDIVDLCEARDRERIGVYTDQATYDNRAPGTDVDWVVTGSGENKMYYHYRPTVSITVGFHTNGRASVKVVEGFEEFKARVDAIEFPKDVPVIVNRGIWKSGEEYQILDLVEHPDDPLRRLIAMQNHLAKSKLILNDKAVWCQLSV